MAAHHRLLSLTIINIFIIKDKRNWTAQALLRKIRQINEEALLIKSKSLEHHKLKEVHMLTAMEKIQ